MSNYYAKRKRDRSRPTGNRIKLVSKTETASCVVKLRRISDDREFSQTLNGIESDYSDYPVTLGYTPKSIKTVVTEQYAPFRWVNPKAFERRGFTTTRSKSYFGDPPSGFVFSSSDVPAVIRASLPNALWPSVTPTAEDLHSHYLDFNSKLANQKVDVLTTVAEARSTLTMMGSLAKSLFTLYRGVRKADPKLVSEALSGRKVTKRQKKGFVSQQWKNKTAQNRWLELQYGWSPLFADLKTAFEEMSTLPEADLLKFTKSTRIQRECRFSQGNRAGTSGTEDVVIKTSCYYVQDQKNVRKAAQWNLGVNPLLTAWELVPYSFVIDWFLPIGDFLTQFSSSAGLKFISGTTVYYTQFECTREFASTRSVTAAGSARRFVCNNIYTQKGYCVRRTVLNSSPIGLPTFSMSLSTGRAINALALITQRIK